MADERNNSRVLKALLAEAAFVRGLARALARDESEADDVAQETLARALASPLAIRASLRAWLAGVTRNVFRMERRSSARRRDRERRSARPEPIPSAAEQAERIEILGRLGRALERLPEPRRSAVILRYYDRRTPTEIAAATGTPIQTVKTRLRRALAQLRDELDRAYGKRQDGGTRAILLLAALPRPAVSPLAGLASAAAAITGALLMTLKSKLAIAALVLLLAGAVLQSLPSTPSEVAPARAAPTAISSSPDPADSTADSGVPANSIRVPGSPSIPGEAAPKPGGESWLAGVVLGPGGRPVAGAHLVVQGGLLAARLSREATTDGEGGFRIAASRGEGLTIQIRAAGMATTSFTARAGGDPVRIHLETGYSISGRVIDDATGRGVPEISITLMRPDPREGDAPIWGKAQEDGYFEFAGLPSGVRDVLVGDGYLSGEADWEEYVPHRIAGVRAGTTDLEIRVVRGLVIEGEVLGCSGNPAPPGLLVYAFRRIDGGRVLWSSYRLVYTREGGRFRIPGLASGLHLLQVKLTTGTTPAQDAPDGEVTEPELVPTTVQSVEAGTRNLIVRMQGGGMIRGRILDETGQPVLGDGHIYVTPAGESPGAPGTVMAKVAGDGIFSTPSLDPATTWDLLATHFPGHMSASSLQVSAGREDVEIVLPTAGRIEGRVLDPDGKPVPAGVPVLAQAVGVEAATPGASSTAYTGKNGEFVLEGVRGYDYALRAGGGESAFRPGPEVTRLRAGAVEVELSVRVAVALTGRVLDAEGRPMQAVTITAWQDDSVPLLTPYARVLNEEGRFELRSLSPGKVRLWVVVEGESIPLGAVTAPADEIELRMPADGTSPR